MKLRSKDVTLEKEPYGYGQRYVMTWRDKCGIHRAPLGAGTDDELYFYRQVGTDLLYVLAVNDRMPYVGVEVFDGSDHDEHGEALESWFFQEWECDHYLLRGWEDLRPHNIIKVAVTGDRYAAGGRLPRHW